MATSKLTPFFIRPKDLKKDSATLFMRVHTRKIDALVSTHISMDVEEWRRATATPKAFLAHQKKNYQLHAKLTAQDNFTVHMLKSGGLKC